MSDLPLHEITVFAIERYGNDDAPSAAIFALLCDAIVSYLNELDLEREPGQPPLAHPLVEARHAFDSVLENIEALVDALTQPGANEGADEGPAL